MKAKEKRMILILIVVAVVIIGILLMWKKSTKENEGEQEEIKEKYVQVLEDGTKLNTSSKLKETKKLDDIEIKGIQLTHESGRTIVLATATNTGTKDLTLTPVILTLYDDAGNKLEVINGIISPVKAGESVQVNIGATRDYANAYDFTIVKK